MQQASPHISDAAFQCAIRGLYASAAWLGDVAMDRSERVSAGSVEGLDAAYVAAFAVFNTKQFSLAASLLPEADATPPARFLRLYAQFLSADAAQTQRDERMAELWKKTGPSEKDPFVLFVFALVAIKVKQTENAIDLLVSAVAAFPLLFAAWEELASIIVSPDQLQQILKTLPPTATQSTNPCYTHFLFATSNHLATLHEASHNLSTLKTLTNPSSTCIQLAEASMYYHHQDHPTSISLFNQIYTAHPFLLDKCDEYANALYVLEDAPTLSHLAHRCNQVDEYRPETCIAIANYYSIRGEHEKAVAYLKRAVVLDKGNSLPWTLIGHEYLEMKNQAAAIEVYRKAVDINERDFRAWYALGNLYQMLKMPLYALFYFQKATNLKSYDSRFWAGLGSCYEDLTNFPDAIRCYKRALTVDESVRRGTSGGGVLIKVARLYDRWSAMSAGGSGGGSSQEAAAAVYYRQVFLVCSGFARENGEKGDSQETNHADALEAVEFLLRYACAKHEFQNLDAFLGYAESRGTENEKALARECRALMNN
ncbi:Anaphase-promoting complex subunit 23 [Podochytrium sp. JEL0797]|nr:Anaphase-promoting complex subunit 23 [Podochytrium sp. JEL0797]